MSELFGNPEQVSELSGNPGQLPYTPTTEEVRESYVLMQKCSAYPEPEAEFDRWLAEVKAQAWEEGNFAEDIGPDMRASNPYRHPYRQGEEQ